MNSRRGAGLDFTGTFSRFPSSDLDDVFPHTGSRRKAATLVRLEQELKDVKEENARLRSEVTDLRSLMDEMVSPGGPEKFDERRVNLLKAQILQLQRQCSLLNDAIGSRYTTLMEVENCMAAVADALRVHIAADVSGASVPVPRAELMKLVQNLESARIRLFKNLEDNTRDNLQRTLLFSSEFLAPGSSGLTLLDVASGRMDHIHLKQVSKLESKLAVLYKEVVALSEVLYVQESQHHPLLSPHTASAVRERFHTQLLKAAAMLKDCSEDLLSLSVLVPSAPSCKIRRTVVKGVSVQEALSRLPSLPRYKAEEVQSVVKAVVKCMNHRQQLLEKEVQALRREVKFHQAVYQLQLNYVFSLIQAVRAGYMEFQDSVNEVLVKPLKGLLNSYQAVKARGDEVSLRNFFISFKEREDQLSEAVKKLGVECSFSSGLESLSGFGADFEASLEKLVAEQQDERDVAAQERGDLKEEQERMDSELRVMIGSREAEGRRLEDLRQFAVENSPQNPNHHDLSLPNNDGAPFLEGFQLEKTRAEVKDMGHDRDVMFRTPSVAGHSELGPPLESLKLREWKNPPLHQPEWKGPLDGSDDEVSPRQSCMSTEVDTARSMGTSRRTNIFDGEGPAFHPALLPKDKKTARSTSRPPRPTTYQPNLAVANRALKLRRAENLSRRLGADRAIPGLEGRLGEDPLQLHLGTVDTSPPGPSGPGMPQTGDRTPFTPTSGRRSRSNSRSGRRSGGGPDRPHSADRK